MTKPNQTAEELTVFQSFAKHYATELTGIEARNPPEPDIRCKSSHGDVLAFELVELIDQEYARALSAMFTLTAEFEKYFKSLSGNPRQLLDATLKNAAVFVKYTETATLQQKRSVVPTIFKFLESLKPADSGDFQTDGAGSLNSVVNKIRVLRGNFNGPSWNIVTAGLLDDLPINRISDKFAKSYSTDAKKIELLAFFQTQPLPVPDFVPLIEDSVRSAIGSSRFSAVWIYSVGSDEVLSHILK
jgi:hypothetical protein